MQRSPLCKSGAALSTGFFAVKIAFPGKRVLHADKSGFVIAKKRVQMDTACQVGQWCSTGILETLHELPDIVAARQMQLPGELTVYRVFDNHIFDGVIFSSSSICSGV